MELTRHQKRLIDASTAIALDRPTDQDKAFLARQLVQTTLPHADPGNVPVWSRSNGNLTLTIQQGYDDDGKPYGHPFGTIPRLLMYWMTTEAIRTKCVSRGQFYESLDIFDGFEGISMAIGIQVNQINPVRWDIQFPKRFVLPLEQLGVVTAYAG